EVDDLVDVADLQNREDWAEDFFLHHGRVWRHIRQDRRREEAASPVVLTAVINRSTREQVHQPSEVTVADDPAVVRAFLWIIAVKPKNRFFQMFQERFGDVLEHEDIVRCRTGLASVRPAALRNSTR